MLGFGDSLLAIYLNDHLAGATGGLQLARRIANSNRTNSYGPVLEELAQEIAEDRQALEEVMARLSIRQDRLKIGAAWVGEKAGRLKLNGQLTGYSPLSRLEELEGLSLGVEGKLAMWQALSDNYGDDPRLGGIDFEELIKRARSQRRRLERQRRKAAETALA